MKDANTAGAVLVVEDEAMVNLDVSEALRDDGFETVQSYSGEEALSVLETRSDIRVVFADVNLPGTIDGIQLAREVQRRWPQIELLMTSSHKASELGELDVVSHYGRFVPKPYPPHAVARRIHDILKAAA
jgi:two-component system, response regulator PdtaR